MEQAKWKAGRETKVQLNDDYPTAHIDGPGVRGDVWTSRIILYADTVVAANLLRDKIIDLLNGSAEYLSGGWKKIAENFADRIENKDREIEQRERVIKQYAEDIIVLEKNLAASSNETNQTALQRNELNGQLAIAKSRLVSQEGTIKDLQRALADEQEENDTLHADLKDTVPIDKRTDVVLDGLKRMGIDIEQPLFTRDGDMVRILGMDHDNGTPFVIIGEITEDTPTGPKYRLARFSAFGVIQGTLNAKRKHSIAPTPGPSFQVIRSILPEFDMLMNLILKDFKVRV